MSRTKRPRSISPPSSEASDSISLPSPPSSPSTPPPKIYHREADPSSFAFSCSLPPTCHLAPTYYATATELGRHEEVFHRWVCRASVRDRDREAYSASTSGALGSGSRSAREESEAPESFVRQVGSKRWRECLKVFPEERLLQLHGTETHDPIVKERQKNGEKVFECFLPPEQCGKTFSTPKTRRLHMISKHKYPVQYFWSITNHGINEIARQDGLAISLIRPRTDIHPSLSPTSKLTSHHRQPRLPPQSPPQPQPQPQHSSASSPASALGNFNLGGGFGSPETCGRSSKAGGGGSGETGGGREGGLNLVMDDLTAAMGGLESSLSFVPRNVRKGRRGVKLGGMDIG
ncbi:hypothetical protein B9479_008053 [Cryptococcus floricola]|uniref:C2H2-type domain-containing protein n=1 Tax=Cryptococcus floricola TaxID=2591691 RepID=A0A5D3AIL1_9TREE|nr:hypothetical protein B9479_008053 [Cryptococcus floricola]